MKLNNTYVDSVSFNHHAIILDNDQEIQYFFVRFFVWLFFLKIRDLIALSIQLWQFFVSHHPRLLTLTRQSR